MLIYRITFGGMTNESNNINNGENNSDDEPTVVTRSSSSALFYFCIFFGITLLCLLFEIKITVILLCFDQYKDVQGGDLAGK